MFFFTFSKKPLFRRFYRIREHLMYKLCISSSKAPILIVRVKANAKLMCVRIMENLSLTQRLKLRFKIAPF